MHSVGPGDLERKWYLLRILLGSWGAGEVEEFLTNFSACGGVLGRRMHTRIRDGAIFFSNQRMKWEVGLRDILLLDRVDP